MERVRFLKTGAEAVAAAVRIARVVTGREDVLGCGYHGWLDWCQGRAEASRAATRALFAELPFNDPERAREMIRYRERPPGGASSSSRWSWRSRRASGSRRCAPRPGDAGAVLVFDEIKTAFRLAVGGATERYGVVPDLVVLGKALANGFPLAAVGGRADVMAGVNRTWISSTLATESVALAAALATLEVFEQEHVCAHLHRVGTELLHGLHRLQHEYRHAVTGVGGVAEMCFLHYASEDVSRTVAAACARRGLLFKRTAYNFVSLAHGAADIASTLAILEDVLKSA